MALFRATVKHTRVSNGVRLEKGMSVEFPFPTGAPLSNQKGRETIIEAFRRMYGVDIKKVGAVSSSYLEVVKLT